MHAAATLPPHSAAGAPSFSPQDSTAHRTTGHQGPGPAGTVQAENPTLVEVSVAGQACGIPVMVVRDVLDAHPVTRVPLAVPEIAGSLNLRGRVVTVVDLRRRLGLPGNAAGPQTYVVVELGSELYALSVDQVSAVASIQGGLFERNPPNLPTHWARFSDGVFRLPDRLLLLLSVERVLDISGG